MYCPECGAAIEDSYKFCKSCGIALTGQGSSGNNANKQGIGVAGTKDEAESYRKAAEQGDAQAQYKLGVCYANGFGIAPDRVEAVKWYRKAAEQWDADAQYALGFCYDSIESGVKQDKAEAVKWYRQAAEQGNAKAQQQLGFCYYNGSGVAEDRVVAVKWLCKAAEQGNAQAQYSFGYFCENGLGVVQDKVEAVEWYRKAAEQGNEQAQKRLELITRIPSDAKAAPVEVEPENSICPVCNYAIKRENSLACPTCGVKYHQECWKTNFGCSTYGCPMVGSSKPRPKPSVKYETPKVTPITATARPYSNYTDVPVYRRQWFCWLMCLIITPVGLLILLTGDVYYTKNGEVKSFGVANRIVAGIIAAIWFYAII